MVRRVSLILLLVGVLAVGAGPGDVLFAPLGQIYQVIRSHYYRASEVSDSVLLHGAIQGVIDSLDDPYSTYFTPEEYQGWQDSLSGEYSGVGIEITLRNGRVTVVTPFPGTPAYAGGIRPGDWIMAVDGDSTEGWTLERTSSRIRGEMGTTVVLTVEHEDGTIEDIALVRQRIQIEAVQSEYRAEENIGYIRIMRFDFDTPGLLGKALFSFPLQDLAGLVIDLRNNPGGVLSAAVEAASYFVDRGVIVRTRGPSFGERTYSSRGNSVPNLPVAILVNKGTASAAEIMAGAIQDYGMGVLIGTQTFGKGLVQEIVMRLPDGGAIKLTTGEYFTPTGRSVQDVGLPPDIVVERVEGEQSDSQLNAAVEWIESRAGVLMGAGE
ncbi:MAG: S41 family peptidase [Candidatus Bipolaricaulota bacterium]